MSVVLCKHTERVDITQFHQADYHFLCTCCGHVELEPRCCG